MNLDKDESQASAHALKHGLRFVHTADLHLDSPLRSLALRDPALAELVENATRTVLERIVKLCIDKNVDALLIAGDLYDGNQKSMHTAALLINQMRRLENANIPVYIIRGNHDFEAAITKRLSLPDNVYVFSKKGESVDIDGTNATIHGISFGASHIPESLLPKFPQPQLGQNANTINIGMLHTSLNGGAGHDEYAPCSVKELDEFGYDYWALGHIHKRSEHGTNSKIVMPGIPQGRDIGEAGPGTVSLVNIDDDKRVEVEEIPVAPAQFESVEVSLSDCNDWNRAISLIQERLAQQRDNTTADHLIARVVLTGETNLHFRLVRDRTLLLELIREHCSSTGNTWIEKLLVETRSVSEQDQANDAQIALPDLNAILNSSVFNSDHVHTLAAKELEQFVSKLPTEIKHLFGNTEEERQAILDELLRTGSESLLQNISTGEDA